LSETKESEKYKYIFQNRLKYLQQSYNDFLSLLPEVEIDYSLQIKDLCKELNTQIRNYHDNINEYIQLVDDFDVINNPHHNKLNRIIFNNGKDNQTTISFNETIERLEKQLLKEIKK
jgi:hypothetical protein